MTKKSEKLSVIITVIFGVVFLAALFSLTLWLPTIVNSLIDIKDELGNEIQITELGRLLVLADAYVIVVLAVVTVVFLFKLLAVVYKRKVFSKKAARLISAISWCCFGEGLLFAFLLVYFQFSICVVAAVCFLGFALRIVKHVIEEATLIKEENDFTI